MLWLGRGRPLYKLSMGGHSALVSKDHVCESGFPVREAFAKGLGLLTNVLAFEGPANGALRPAALGPPVLRGNQAGRTGPVEGRGQIHRRRYHQGLGRGRGRPGFRGLE